MRRLSYNDMQCTSGGKDEIIRGPKVHIKSLTPEERNRVIVAFEQRGNEVIDPEGILDVGCEPMTYGGWANTMRQEPEANSIPIIPVTVAANIFPEDERLQRAASRYR